MAELLSQKDRKQIQANQKKPEELPVIGDKAISRSFEAHLILTTDAVKKNALKWIELAEEESQVIDTDREDLLNEFKEAKNVTIASKLNRIKELIDGFEAFRSAFVTGIPNTESQEMIKLLNLALKKYVENKDYLEHQEILTTILK